MSDRVFFHWRFSFSMSYAGHFFAVGVMRMSKACAQRIINSFGKDAAPIRTLAVHVMNHNSRFRVFANPFK